MANPEPNQKTKLPHFDDLRALPPTALAAYVVRRAGEAVHSYKQYCVPEARDHYQRLLDALDLVDQFASEVKLGPRSQYQETLQEVQAAGRFITPHSHIDVEGAKQAVEAVANAVQILDAIAAQGLPFDLTDLAVKAADAAMKTRGSPFLAISGAWEDYNSLRERAPGTGLGNPIEPEGLTSLCYRNPQ